MKSNTEIQFDNQKNGRPQGRPFHFELKYEPVMQYSHLPPWGSRCSNMSLLYLKPPRNKDCKEIMPTDGYFYTFLTNYSDTQVSFDNLTIHHKQGVLRTQYDYYPYGLVWGRQLTPNPNKGYNETYQGSEFNYHEWGDVGLDMNYFEARYYDPVLGRFHAPDPYQQFHSPYMANFDDPANHIDPDGRASKNREWNLQSITGAATELGFLAWVVFGGNSGVGQAVEAVAALANLGGAISTISSIANGGGLANLTHSPTVPDASASLQSSMNGNGPETGAGGAEEIGVTDPPSGDPYAMQMNSNGSKSSYSFYYGSHFKDSPDGDLNKDNIRNQTGSESQDKIHRAIYVQAFSNATNFEGRAAKKDALKLMTTFLDGTGPDWHSLLAMSFDSYSEISKELSKDKAFVKLANDFELLAKVYFNKYGSLDGFDGSGFLKEIIRNNETYFRDSFFNLATMGGFAALDIDVDIDESGQFIFTYKIWDHYGAGTLDMNSDLPGLPDMYYLQHVSSDKGYKPFLWNLTIKR